MIRRLTLTASLAILATMALASKSYAQSSQETVRFSGNVNAACTFSGTKPGTLAEQLGGLSSTPEEGGTEGETTVDCTSPSTMTVSPPRQIQAPPGFVERQGRSVSSISYDGQSAFSDSAGGFNSTSLQVPAGDSILKVGIFIRPEDDENIPSGVYQYEVDVTATPN